MLLVSIVPVMAEETSDDLTREEMREKGIEAREEMKDARKDLREKMKDARNEMKEMRKSIREHRKESREKMKLQREKISRHKDELRKCRGSDTEDCRTKRKEAKGTAKETLLAVAERALTFLESTKEKVSNSDLDNKDELLQKFNARIEEVNSALDTVNALGEDSTKDEYHAAAKALRSTVKGVKSDVRNGAHNLIRKKMSKALKKGDQLTDKLERTIKRLERKGIDTSGVDISGLDAKIDEAEDLYAEAISLFEQARNAAPGDKDELMKQATEKQRESHKALKDARVMLRDIIREIKGLKGGEEALEADDGEADADGEDADGEADETDAEAADAEDADGEDMSEANETANAESNASTDDNSEVQ